MPPPQKNHHHDTSDGCLVPHLAGTTACGLRFGKPTAIVHFFGDQPFWGSAVRDAGVGAEPICIASVTAERLAAALRTLLLPDTHAAAEALAEKLRLEDGAKGAVASLHAHMRRIGMFEACTAEERAAVGQLEWVGYRKALTTLPPQELFDKEEQDTFLGAWCEDE